MPKNPFDQASRYTAKLDSPAILGWLLRLPTSAVLFRGWLDTRLIPFPGEADRTCDTVAFLEDVLRGQLPWAVILEFQLEPDALMFGRLVVYAGQVWLELKPSAERGDRFQLGAILVNLTGRGSAARTMHWPEAGLLTALQPREINLCDIDAASTLDGIAAGTAPGVVLPFIPLMHGGEDLAIIQRWIALASAESDDRRRGDYGGLALIFAEAAGSRDIWKQALKGWNIVQSQQVLEWMSEGEMRGRAAILLRVLRLRFGTLPAELESAIQAETELAKFDLWAEHAVNSPSLAAFRAACNL